MSNDEKPDNGAFLALKNSLVADAISLSDEAFLRQLSQSESGDEARSRVFESFRRAWLSVGFRVGGESPFSAPSKSGPLALSIDATKAREILKRVSARSVIPSSALPLVAQAGQNVSDPEGLERVAALKAAGIVSDDDLK